MTMNFNKITLTSLILCGETLEI